MVERDLSDSVLSRLIRGAGADSSTRFMLTRSIDRSGGYRVSYPGGRFNARPEIIEDLLARKLVQVIEQQPGYLVLGITVRGFDYYSRYIATKR